MHIRDKPAIYKQAGFELDAVCEAAVRLSRLTLREAYPRVQGHLEGSAGSEARDETAHSRYACCAMRVREFCDQPDQLMSCHENFSEQGQHTLVLDNMAGDLELLEGDLAVAREEEHVPLVVAHDGGGCCDGRGCVCRQYGWRRLFGGLTVDRVEVKRGSCINSGKRRTFC